MRESLTTTTPLKLLAHHEVVLTEKFFPCTITDLCRSLGRTDDISEEHRCKHAIRLWTSTYACLESLDFIAEIVNVTRPK